MIEESSGPTSMQWLEAFTASWLVLVCVAYQLGRWIERRKQNGTR